MMSIHESWRPSGRQTRWYEWLLILLLLGMIGGVRAETVYRCADAQGGIAYQSQACAEAQQSTRIDLPPAAAYAPSPQYRLDRAPKTASSAAAGTPRERVAQSWECRAADGQVFYRHGACPHSIAAEAKPNDRAGTKPRHGSHASAHDNGRTLQVTSRRITRDEACHEIHAAGAIGRRGHEHDEDVSTYDHNLGRDPCH